MAAGLRILAVEPWLGGSHARFLEGWRARSAHDVTVLGLPARHWKWRMEGGAFELASRVKAEGIERPDVLLATDFLDLPRFLGFLPPAWGGVPTLLYLHENQLTYPPRHFTLPGAHPAARDVSFGFTNVLSCLAAERVVFNSAYHLETFWAAAREMLSRLPQPHPGPELEHKLCGARVVGPGIELDALPLGPGPDPGSPLRVAFNHRWEHDKDPAAFLTAVLVARERGASIELVLLGEVFDRTPPEVAGLVGALGDALVHRGYTPSREEYARLLGRCDLVVSSARHEPYGMALLEGVAVGCAPLAPRRLAYPEVLGEQLEQGLYGEWDELVERLASAAAQPERFREPRGRGARRRAVEGHDVGRTARAMDRECEKLAPAWEGSP